MLVVRSDIFRCGYIGANKKPLERPLCGNLIAACDGCDARALHLYELDFVYLSTIFSVFIIFIFPVNFDAFHSIVVVIFVVYRTIAYTFAHKH